MRRARQVLGALVVVNVVMLWFFAGASASLSWHDRMLADDTLRACGQTALSGTRGGWSVTGETDAEFVGEATVRFDATVTTYATGRSRTVPVECELGTREDAQIDDPLEVLGAEVVR
ncbi:hypothetical protein [Nocardioides sp. Soil805]|uniref:hypothetical protein n=1 Tax=Nocardioides sp. Soil805 TaxID=1736416 RepID=UPI0007029A6F|nr:hypothetical protein [Nocardioides sp. Soil805]KRF35369.1 hypothetical protein ASG94_14830 [Nocardioides sp. Soil805]